jgi:excisionase family DNA binding protein
MSDHAWKGASFMGSDDLILNGEQAAKLLGTHIDTLRRIARNGEIPSFKLGREWRFRTSDLNRWIETHHLRTRKPEILVVDDDARVRYTLRRLLEPENYHIHEAANGAQALALLKESVPDIVLLDLNMPGMDGSEVLKEIRENYESLAVIIITASPDGDLMEAAFRYPPVTVLPKPLTQELLLQTLNRFLPNPASKMLQG